tara:strand:- start:450 stop:563 length:114 start_codon:yes stop_codon:yes gene_type:complete
MVLFIFFAGMFIGVPVVVLSILDSAYRFVQAWKGNDL